MIESFHLDMRSILSRFFIEALTEKQVPYTILPKDDPSLRPFAGMGLKGMALHIRNNRIVGMVLNDSEYSEEPILFQEGVEDLFRPLFHGKQEVHLLSFVHELTKQDGIGVKALLLDIPYSKVYLSFQNTEAFVADSSEDLQV